jgi:hypothetical protein
MASGRRAGIIEPQGPSTRRFDLAQDDKFKEKEIALNGGIAPVRAQESAFRASAAKAVLNSHLERHG